MIPAGATDTEHATDAETREHDELELRLMSGEGTDADKARYSKLHPKVCARKVAESGGEGEEG